MADKASLLKTKGIVHRKGGRPMRSYIVFFVGSVIATVIFIFIAESPRFGLTMTTNTLRDLWYADPTTRELQIVMDKNDLSVGNASHPSLNGSQSNASVTPLPTVLTTTKPIRVVEAPRNSGIRQDYDVKLGLEDGTNFTIKFLARRFEANLIGGALLDDYGQLPEHFMKNVSATKIAGNFTIRPRNIENANDFFFMIFLVKSTCARADRRENVRKTWGAIRDINGKRFGVLFLVGKSANEKQQAALQVESDRHGDILQSDVGDGYRDLPAKVLSGYQWVHYEQPNASDFYGFTDDDCMINLPRTFDYFMSNHEQFLTSNTIYCGFIYNPRAGPIRGASKYAIDKTLYPNQRYPPFCHGGMSVLARPLLSDLYRMAEITNRSGFHLEDVYISALLRTKLGRGQKNIQPINHAGTRRVYQYHMGPFSWHLGLSRDVFSRVWRVVYNMMSVTANNATHQGFWHTAKALQATASGDVIAPGDDNIAQYFRENFATANR